MLIFGAKVRISIFVIFVPILQNKTFLSNFQPLCDAGARQWQTKATKKYWLLRWRFYPFYRRILVVTPQTYFLCFSILLYLPQTDWKYSSNVEKWCSYFKSPLKMSWPCRFAPSLAAPSQVVPQKPNIRETRWRRRKKNYSRLSSTSNATLLVPF